MHVLLIGLRCSGKTTVGRLLAERLKRPFIDLDDRTAALLNSPTAGEALRAHGEAAFRAAEVKTLRECLDAPGDFVIALGGGTPIAPGASALLLDAQGRGIAAVVYLRALPVVLAARLAGENAATRPALLGSDPVSEVPALFQQRDAMYVRLADRVIDAVQPVASVVDELVTLQRG